MRTILVCGDRNWTDDLRIIGDLATTMRAIRVVTGGARGADRLAEDACRQLGIRCDVYSAEWKRYGRGAGPIRNKRMLDEGKPDEVWAYHENLEASKGTADMVRRAKRAGLPVRLVSGTGPATPI